MPLIAAATTPFVMPSLIVGVPNNTYSMAYNPASNMRANHELSSAHDRNARNYVTYETTEIRRIAWDNPAKCPSPETGPCLVPRGTSRR
jgi:hypothetical protein